MSLQSQNITTMEAHHSAWNRQDIDAVLAFYAEDTRNHGRPVGRAGIAMVIRDIFTTFPDTQMKVIDTVASGDEVISITHFSGTHLGVGKLPINGGLMVGVAPTGKAMSVQHIHWVTMRNGLIVEHRANRDDVAMMQQLGLLPAPPAFAPPPR